MRAHWTTRNGTRVLSEDAARRASNWEIFHGSETAEFRTYRMLRLRSGEIFAEAPDPLLVRPVDSGDPNRIHLLNLTHGAHAIATWDDLAHCVAPNDLG